MPVSGFRELKVPDDVLCVAGFDSATGRSGRDPSPAGRQRAKAVSVEEIQTYVLAQTGTFVLADIMTRIGGSQATVRKAMVAGFFARLELVERGVVPIEEWRPADRGLEPVKVAVYGAVGPNEGSWHVLMREAAEKTPDRSGASAPGSSTR